MSKKKILLMTYLTARCQVEINFSYYIPDPPISADGFLPAHRLAFQHSRRLWPRPCCIHVPQVSFCHFPYYYHIAPGKLLLVALMCQKQTSVILIRKRYKDSFYNNFLPIQSSNSDLQLGENLSKLHFPNPRTRS